MSFVFIKIFLLIKKKKRKKKEKGKRGKGFHLKNKILITGKDKSVVLWSIQDHISTAATSPGSSGSIVKQNTKPGEGNDKAADGPSVGPRGVYLGHEETVEDVTFCPSR
jgi:hypothetical protein